MNRGSDGKPLGRAAANPASMRPRFMNRGSTRNRRPRRGLPGSASMRPRFMNRGSGFRAEISNRPVNASMRPRFMNRGSEHVAFPFRPFVPRFNEAPIHESGKYLNSDLALAGVGASMRPRFMNRGSKSEAPAIAALLLASMRPRFMNRGSQIRMHWQALVCLLQ